MQTEAETEIAAGDVSLCYHHQQKRAGSSILWIEDCRDPI